VFWPALSTLCAGVLNAESGRMPGQGVSLITDSETIWKTTLVINIS